MSVNAEFQLRTDARLVRLDECSNGLCALVLRIVAAAWLAFTLLITGTGVFGRYVGLAAFQRSCSFPSHDARGADNHRRPIHTR